MRKNSKRNLKMNILFLKTFIIAVLLGSLLWVAACANGGTGPGPTGSSYVGSSSGGSSFGTPLAPEQSDPEFWQMWVDMHGGG
jgi:hypothetical protein